MYNRVDCEIHMHGVHSTGTRWNASGGDVSMIVQYLWGDYAIPLGRSRMTSAWWCNTSQAWWCNT